MLMPKWYQTKGPWLRQHLSTCQEIFDVNELPLSLCYH